MSRGFVVKGGKSLPELTAPAGAADIRSGMQAISASGDKLTGTAAIRDFATVPIVNNNSYWDVTFYQGDRKLIVKKSSSATFRVAVGELMLIFGGANTGLPFSFHPSSSATSVWSALKVSYGYLYMINKAPTSITINAQN